MGFLFLSLFIAAVSQISAVASQPFELAPRANAVCSSGDVEYTDNNRILFEGLSKIYCLNEKPKDLDWIAGDLKLLISTSADGCTAPATIQEKDCKESFKKIVDACSAGAKVSGGKYLWNGPDGTCLKYSLYARKIEVVNTTFESHPELNEVDIGAGLYSCDDYMKLFDEAKKGCLSVGCDVNKKACDSHACATIDGTTTQGVGDKFKDYLDQLRGVIAGSCKQETYDGTHYRPDGNGGNVKKVKVQIPSFIGSSTAKDGAFVANFKVAFTEKAVKSSCDIATALLAAGVGVLPGGSLFGATSVACNV